MKAVSNDLIDTITEAARTKVFKRTRVIRFMDERNESGDVSIVQLPRDSAVFNDLEWVFSKKFEKSNAKLNRLAI